MVKATDSICLCGFAKPSTGLTGSGLGTDPVGLEVPFLFSRKTGAAMLAHAMASDSGSVARARPQA